MNRRMHGFTLLELLVVALIIGLLTSIVGPRFMSQLGRSEVSTAKAQIDALGKALDAYRIDVGRYPGLDVGLRALTDSSGHDERWRGPYLKGTVPLDPWGTPYQYRTPGPDGRDFEIVSLGRDRAPGGTGDSADISN